MRDFKQLIEEYLAEFCFSQKDIIDLIYSYSAPNRYYHNLAHLADVWDYITENGKDHLDEKEMAALKLAVIFHDVIYDPKRNDNEKESAEYFSRCFRTINPNKSKYGKLFPYIHDATYRLIMKTETHECDDSSPLDEQLMIKGDLCAFTFDFETVWQNNVNIWKEYSWVDWGDFSAVRISFVEKYAPKVKRMLGEKAEYNIERLIACMRVWKPNIAVYPGSFNPFHIGHLDVLKKADAIFDKVIIARGKNPDKSNNMVDLPEYVHKHYQVDHYEGLLTDYIMSKSYDLTVIRGLRNSKDLQYEIK